MIYYLIAMEREAEMLDVENKHIIGINATNMPKTTKDDIIVNVGYCGGHKLAVGEIIEPNACFYTKNRKKANIGRIFGLKRARCYTADKFVVKPIVDFESIYDMELYKIAQIPHKKLYAIKIVSDNLNESDCESFNDKEVWDKVNKIIKGVKL